MLYDIYLRNRCYTQPVLKDLQASIPLLKDPAIQKKLVPYSKEELNTRGSLRSPGFLGLSLEEGLARELYSRLAAVKATGEVVPSAYREPKITQEQAQKIAEQELSRICQEQFPTYHFEPIRLYRDELRWWAFSTFSKQWQEEHGPIWGSGGPVAYVDKLDGHIWRWE